jgi:HlyD family secretion protein
MSSNAHRPTEDIAAVLAGGRSKSGFRTLRRGVAILLILVAAFVGYALVARGESTTALEYRTEAVTRGDLHVTVSATGKLQPTNEVEVGSEVSGLVETVFVDDNDSVKKGQELLRLDTSKLRDQAAKSRAALQSAEARLEQAAATVKEASANLERLREVSKLSGGKVPSKSEMEAAEATLARAVADQSSARASVSEAKAAHSADQINLSKASIRSPIDGIVLTRSVEPGQTVAASFQVATLFTLAEDLSEMELEVDVDEADVGVVRAGQPATFTVDAYAGRQYPASVTRVRYGSETTNGVVSYPTLLAVRNDDLTLRPGMTASAEIATASRTGAVLVANAALRFTPPATNAAQQNTSFLRRLMPGPPRRPGQDQKAQAEPKGGSQTVWLIKDGQPSAVRVSVGLTDGRMTEVLGGLEPGTKVITDTAVASK